MKTSKFYLQIFFCLILISVAVCEPKWYQSKFGNNYLIEIEEKYNWFQASNECARRDLQLISVITEEKNNDLKQLLKKEFGGPVNLWLGGTDLYSKVRDLERPFYWATGHAFLFSYWAKSNPANYAAAEHCVHIWKDAPEYRWNDNVCNHKKYIYGYICEETLATQRCKLVEEIVNKLVCDEVPIETYVKDL